MFYYFGRKRQKARLYPDPRYDVIIEPFAGSAAYSLHGDRWKKEVVLYDTNPVVCQLWRYLVAAKPAEIRALPSVKQGQDIREIPGLSDEERYLIGFHINPGSIAPRNIVTRFSRWEVGREYVASNLHKVRHWVICNQSFTAAPHIAATWFIDPPYQQAGYRYPYQPHVSYEALGVWCRHRQGQVMVCENAGATWLPFEPLASTKSCGRKRSVEALWTNDEAPDAIDAGNIPAIVQVAGVSEEDLDTAIVRIVKERD